MYAAPYWSATLNPLKNQFGSVKPYTRHLLTCPHRIEKDHNSCPCPKWLYEKRKGSKPRRHSLTTPSWAEAMRQATTTLRGFDPEIAEARQQKVAKSRTRKTIEEVVQMWLDRTEHMYGK